MYQSKITQPPQLFSILFLGVEIPAIVRVERVQRNKMATATLTLCIGLIVILLYKILHNYYKQIKFCRNYPTYCPLLPIIGHGYVYFGMKGEDILTRVMEIVSCDSKHRKLALVIGNSWTVWYYHPEPIEEILSSTSMITKSDDYDYFVVSTNFSVQIQI